MGNVARQSFISSISAYFGVAIGYLNVIILMPKFMTQEEIGLFRTIVSMAMLLVPFAFFGSGAAVIKFSPKFRNETSRLLGLLVVIILLAFTAVFGFSVIFQDFLFSLFEEKAARINEYFFLVYGLLFMMVVYNFFQAVSKANYSIILPNFLTDFFYKSVHALVIVLFGFGILSFHQYLISHFFIYIVLCLILGISVIRSFDITFTLKGIFAKSFFREIFDFISFSFLGSFGIIMVLQIDQIMVSQMLGLDQNGIYTTAVFMALVIELPRRYVSQIIHPYIADDLQKENYSKVNENYRETSDVLIWLGGFLFIVITLNLDNIYHIMPNGEGFVAGFWIVYIVGATKLIDMLFSVNGEIISISRYYRINVILIVFLGILTVVTNRIFIPIYGMHGAATASLLTYLVFNVIKYIILKVNFRLDPFSLKSILIIAFLIAVYYLISLIPPLADPWIDLIARCAITGAIMILSIYILRPSEEIINLISVILNRVRKT